MQKKDLVQKLNSKEKNQVKRKVHRKKLKNGYLFWITGLSGSGKTTVAKKIKRDIEKLYGPTVVISGDDIRNIFNFKGYSYKERSTLAMKYCRLSLFLTNQNINVIFAVVGLFNKARLWNKKNIKNYCEIYLKTDLKKLIRRKDKKFYSISKEVVGINIKPEFPKYPHITISNNFKESINTLSKKLIKKIIINCPL